MRYLLDSHTLLWYTLGNAQLSTPAKRLIVDTANEILISPATYWEIAIKISIGKLILHQPYADFIDACLNTHGFTILPIDPKHTAQVIDLPFHHKDPIDRLLVAQALVERISIISGDRFGFGRIRHRKALVD
ncbi:MAG TPA: type II toxin-antitoxin system VapC family toxin [Lacipirellulaceae bacterium]|nr:type II toxin-antitoxin system VapC family toxin [Lacipirellulaceae bacterium]